MPKLTYTITFGDRGENHVGMQQIGSLKESGFTFDETEEAQIRYEKKGFKTEFIDLSIEDSPQNEAAILIIRNAVKNPDELLKEQKKIDYDDKAFMYGRVVNKKARHNVCFDYKSQEPDYEEGKGRIVAFKKVPLLFSVMNDLSNYLGEKAKGLVAEGNYYYDINKCGIGYHGDAERRIVIALRLGASLPIHYQWYKQNEPIGDNMSYVLNHGDMYIMSEKATGFDWKKRSIMTLRHAAGCETYTTIKEKKKTMTTAENAQELYKRANMLLKKDPKNKELKNIQALAESLLVKSKKAPAKKKVEKIKAGKEEEDEFSSEIKEDDEIKEEDEFSSDIEE